MEVPDEGQDRPERLIPVNVQGHKGTRVVIVRLTRKRGDRRPPRPARDWSARAEDRGRQPKGPASGERSPAKEGQDTLAVPPVKERPAVGGGDSTQTSSEDAEVEREEVPPPAGEKSELGTGRSPQDEHAPTRGTTAGRATTTSTLVRGLLRMRPATGQTGHRNDT